MFARSAHCSLAWVSAHPLPPLRRPSRSPLRADQSTSAVALGLAPGSVVATLGSFSLVVNVFLASAILGERVNACDLIATLAILAGDGVAVYYSGSRPPPPLRAGRLFRLATRPGFMHYATALGALFVVCLVGFCALTPARDSDVATEAEAKLDVEHLDQIAPKGTPRRNRMRSLVRKSSSGFEHTPSRSRSSSPCGGGAGESGAGSGAEGLSDAELLHIVDVLARAEGGENAPSLGAHRYSMVGKQDSRVLHRDAAMAGLRAIATSPKVSAAGRRRASSLLMSGGSASDAQLARAAIRGEVTGESLLTTLSTLMITTVGAIVGSASFLFGSCTIQLTKTHLVALYGGGAQRARGGALAAAQRGAPSAALWFAMGGGFLFFAVLNVHCMQVALRRGEALIVVPAYSTLSTLLCIGCGLVFFREDERLFALRAADVAARRTVSYRGAMFVGGVALTLLGILALTVRDVVFFGRGAAADAEDAEAPRDAGAELATETSRLVDGEGGAPAAPAYGAPARPRAATTSVGVAPTPLFPAAHAGGGGGRARGFSYAAGDLAGSFAPPVAAPTGGARRRRYSVALGGLGLGIA